MIVETLAAVAPVEATPTWVLSNHDVVRYVSRYGGGALGLARARAATLTMLGLPGSAYLYQGEELGLPEVEVAPADRRDPKWLRSGVGRDGCRIPLPWSGSAPPYGFGPTGAKTWLPQPAGWGQLSVAQQMADPGSTLRFYQRALRARRDLVGQLSAEVVLLDTAPGVLAFRREPGFVCVLNCGSRRARIDDMGEAIIASADHAVATRGWLAPNTAAWFAAR